MSQATRFQDLHPERAASLGYEDYASLLVEFTPAEDIPDQTDRLVAKAEKRKRGRPSKKNTVE